MSRKKHILFIKQQNLHYKVAEIFCPNHKSYDIRSFYRELFKFSFFERFKIMVSDYFVEKLWQFNCTGYTSVNQVHPKSSYHRLLMLLIWYQTATEPIGSRKTRSPKRFFSADRLFMKCADILFVKLNRGPPRPNQQGRRDSRKFKSL